MSFSSVARAALSPFITEHMNDMPLTGVPKIRLHGLGQTIEPAIKVGKVGPTHSACLLRS